MFWTMRERLINRSRQGDLGEASAIEWLTSKGALVWIPLGHSPDVDLVAQFDTRLAGVQVKATTYSVRTSDGHLRWSASVATNGGNQSWSRESKRFDPAKVDYLFVLAGDGRRWLIPAPAVEAHTSIALGGPKYSEFEIESARPLSPLVYGPDPSSLESPDPEGEYPSGQRTAPVKRLAYAFTGSNPVSPITVSQGATRPGPGPGGRPFSRYATIWGKRRITIPRHVFESARLCLGDRLRATPEGPGRITLERIEPPTGRLGAPDQARRETGLANEQAIAAEDPSYNPYARED